MKKARKAGWQPEKVLGRPWGNFVIIAQSKKKKKEKKNNNRNFQLTAMVHN